MCPRGCRVVRSGMTKINLGRPGERRDPYSVFYLTGSVLDTSIHNHRRWLWVPAFAGTTCWQIAYNDKKRRRKRDDGIFAARIGGPAGHRGELARASRRCLESQD